MALPFIASPGCDLVIFAVALIVPAEVCVAQPVMDSDATSQQMFTARRSLSCDHVGF